MILCMSDVITGNFASRCDAITLMFFDKSMKMDHTLNHTFILQD